MGLFSRDWYGDIGWMVVMDELEVGPANMILGFGLIELGEGLDGSDGLERSWVKVGERDWAGLIWVEGDKMGLAYWLRIRS